MKLNIEELAQEANNKISEMGDYDTQDKRMKEEVSVRRIQSYVTKGLLDRPIKEGNKAYYTEHHLEKLLALRKLGTSGLSDKSLMNMSSAVEPVLSDTDLQRDIMAEISNMKATGLVSKDSTGINLMGSSINNSMSNALNTLSNSNTYQTLQKTTRVWQEVQVDTEGKCYLRIESGSKLKDPEDILKKIKQLLNLGD